VYDFEKTLQFMPSSLLQRSLYRTQIMRYKKHFPDARIKFILFEAFKLDVQSAVDTTCNWLGVRDSAAISKPQPRKNPAIVPKSLRLQILHNRAFRELAAERYVDSHLPGMPSVKSSVFLRAISYAVRKINLTTDRHYPPMKPSTRRFLEKLFAKENRGLSDLIGVDLIEYWPYMED
jgi:hypothetical protein